MGVLLIPAGMHQLAKLCFACCVPDVSLSHVPSVCLYYKDEIYLRSHNSVWRSSAFLSLPLTDSASKSRFCEALGSDIYSGRGSHGQGMDWTKVREVWECCNVVREKPIHMLGKQTNK